MRRRSKRIWLLALGVFVAVFLFTFLVQKFKDLEEADAANLAAFDPGYIISDYQMSNYNSMNESQIQSFLSSKVSCNKDQSYYNYLKSHYSGFDWHFANGHIVCLPEERFGDGETIGSGDSAAHIIWQAAHDYRINPQVLIVLLQKEQGLITDPYPNTRQYRSATGYGCPDTAPCSSQYYGFKNQVRKAAVLFRTVLDGGWTNYPLGNNYIQYNPNAACGGSVVNVRSLATSALYRYTPYQPNSSALAAGYGTGDSCGAYGNRNFYNYFEDWFGGIKDDDSPVYIQSNNSRPIVDGAYQMVSYSNEKMAVDVKGGVYDGMENGRLIGYNKKGDVESMNNQIFKIEYNEKTGFYNIYNPSTNLYFDVEGASVNNNAKVILWPKNNGCNQDWVIKLNSDNSVVLMSRCSSRVLDLTSSSDVIIFSNHNGGNQKWKLVPIDINGKSVDDGVYRINTVKYDKTLDIYGGVTQKTKSGKLVTFMKKRLSDASIDNQLFRISYDKSTGYYKIANVLSGVALDVANSKMNDGASVIVWEGNNGCNQRWKLRKEGGGYKILSACSQKALTVENNEIIIRSDGNSDDQLWALEGYVESFRENKDYQMVSSNGKVADIYGGIVSNMTIGDLVIYTKKTSDKNNQIFRLEYDSPTDSYLIYNPTTRLYLDVRGASSADGADVILFSKNGNCNQRWKVERKPNNKYLIASMCSGKYLSVSMNKLNGNYRLGIYGLNSGMSQEWTFN